MIGLILFDFDWYNFKLDVWWIVERIGWMLWLVGINGVWVYGYLDDEGMVVYDFELLRWCVEVVVVELVDVGLDVKWIVVVG